MSNTTRWRITTDDNFEQIIRKIEAKNGRTLTIGSQNYKNIKVSKGLPSDHEEEILERKIKYTYFNIEFSREQNGDLVRVKHLFVLYEDKGSIFVIINKNTGAKKILRDFLDYSGKNEIEQYLNNISSDFIIWLLSRVYQQDNSYESNEKILILNSIIGFKGNTLDKLSTLSATGDTVMNILSTLSFLLETNSLNQIKIRIQYTEDHDNIEIKIDTNNTLDVSLKFYLGQYYTSAKYQNYSDDHREVLLNILVYCEIIPVLKQWYADQTSDEEENEDAVWNEKRHKDFLEKVAKDLTKQVTDKISLLKDNG